MDNPHAMYLRWSPRLALASAFFLPLRLSLTYIPLVPLLVLWLWHERPRLLDPEKSPFRAQPALLFFILSVLASALFGLRPFESLQGAARLAFYLSAAFVFADVLARGYVLPALHLLLLGQGIAALYTILRLLFPELPYGAIVGTISASGQLSMALVLGAGLLIYHARDPKHAATLRRPSLLTWQAMNLALMTAALIVNLKRGPWFGVLVGGSLLLLFYARRFILPAILSVLVLAVAADPVRSRILDSYEHFVISGGRGSIWEVGVELAAKYPLGIGYDNSSFLRRYSQEIPDNLTHFHNNLLNIAVENGWLALMLYLWWMFSIIGRGLCTRREDRDGILLRALGCALLSWQCAGIVEYNFGDSEVLFVALLLMGAITALSGRQPAAQN